MSIYCDIVEPSTDMNVSFERLSSDFARMYNEAWNKDKIEIYKKAYAPNIGAISRLWLDKTLKLFFAYDSQTKQTVGYLFGVIYRPLSYDALVFRVEDWYGSPEVEKALFAYLRQAIRFLSCDEFIVADDVRPAPDFADGTWILGNEFKYYRYVRK